MFERFSLRPSLSVAAALMLAAAPSLSAQGQALFQWTGTVDRELRLAMRGNDVWTASGTSESARNASRVTSSLPRTSGSVSVRVLEGRGVADIVQQPTPSNNYTTIVRIRDGQGGADRYRIATYWQRDYGTVGGPSQPRIESRDRNGDCQPDPWGILRTPRTDSSCSRQDSATRGGYGDWERGDDANADRRDRNDGWERGRWERGRDDRPGYGRVRGSMHWSGSVDGTVEIRLRRRDIDYRTLSGARPRNVRAEPSGAAINRAVSAVEVRSARGRGSVTVVQQPNARNDYTAIIRVRDPQGGFGSYDFDVIWR
jgi:hypothetical protein